MSNTPDDAVFLTRVAKTIQQSLIAEPEKFDRKVFLCGAGTNHPECARAKIAQGLNDIYQGFAHNRRRPWFENYDVYYPETLFEGLMTGPNSIDLLTLENLLAQAVDAVVIVVESAGTLAELGAFANHEELRKKLVVIQDVRFKHANSFIARGPVRLLAHGPDGEVLYLPLARVDDFMPDIHRAILKVARANPIRYDLSNPLHTHNFVVPCLYLLEKLTRSEVSFLVREVTGLPEGQAEILASIAISMLIRQRLVATEGNAIKLTEQGVREFLSKGRVLDRSAKYRKMAMDQIRIDVLTRQRRRQRSWFDQR